MVWIQFLVAATVVVVGGARLARYGDIIGERSGLGSSWVGIVLLAATTSLPELFTGFAATAVTPLPDIAIGNVLGSCMFNLLILSLIDAMQPEPLSTRAHQGHALSIGGVLLLLGVAGIGLSAGPAVPALAWVGLPTLIIIPLYFVIMRVLFAHERHRRARETREVAEGLRYGDIPLRSALFHYGLAAIAVVVAALWLPSLGAAISEQTGLGHTFVGSLLLAVTTSLPEVAVSVAAVRLGAVDLAVSNLMGSNLFNLLILGLQDVFYLPGPLLGDAASGHLVTLLAVVVMNALFLMALTYRALTKRFVVSWDTGAIAATYALAVTVVYLLER